LLYVRLIGAGMFGFDAEFWFWAVAGAVARDHQTGRSAERYPLRIRQPGMTPAADLTQSSRSHRRHPSGLFVERRAYVRGEDGSRT
jgi:hypothetical protein